MSDKNGEGICSGEGVLGYSEIQLIKNNLRIKIKH